MRARFFWIVSRFAIAVYRRFPIFGPVRGAIAILRRGELFVAIRRNDGLGLSLPGGIARPWEPWEDAMRREVREETGLEIASARKVLQFETSVLYPTSTTVFEATTEGELRGSWEGDALLVTLEQLDREIIPSQRAVVEYLRAQG